MASQARESEYTHDPDVDTHSLRLQQDEASLARAAAIPQETVIIQRVVDTIQPIIEPVTAGQILAKLGVSQRIVERDMGGNAWNAVTYKDTGDAILPQDYLNHLRANLSREGYVVVVGASYLDRLADRMFEQELLGRLNGDDAKKAANLRSVVDTVLSQTLNPLKTPDYPLVPPRNRVTAHFGRTETTRLIADKTELVTHAEPFHPNTRPLMIIDMCLQPRPIDMTITSTPRLSAKVPGVRSFASRIAGRFL